MRDFPWLTWLILTLAMGGYFFWWIRKCTSTGKIEHRNWAFKRETLLEQSEEPEKFDRLIKVWRMTIWLIPILTFGVVYFGDY